MNTTKIRYFMIINSNFLYNHIFNNFNYMINLIYFLLAKGPDLS
jgi:hypothetical protein